MNELREYNWGISQLIHLYLNLIQNGGCVLWILVFFQKKNSKI